MNLGQHAAFIWISYAAVALGVAALLGWLFLNGRRHRRRLAELEARGVRRRSGAQAGGSGSNG